VPETLLDVQCVIKPDTVDLTAGNHMYIFVATGLNNHYISRYGIHGVLTARVVGFTRYHSLSLLFFLKKYWDKKKNSYLPCFFFVGSPGILDLLQYTPLSPNNIS